jgi:hypothetical protein
LQVPDLTFSKDTIYLDTVLLIHQRFDLKYTTKVKIFTARAKEGIILNGDHMREM